MARIAESNGIKETLLRLFGHDDDRSMLAKFARMEPLKKHRVDPDINSNVFKRSSACDNLIKNMLALDAVFNSQDLVCRLAERTVPASEVRREIQRAKMRLEQKLRAYGYWADRLSSLEQVLGEQESLETFALEDRLAVERQESFLGAPYALRAVRLLEKVEEEGRLSLLSPDQLNEKAWALYRLGLSDQAVAAARQAVEADAEHAEAWMLLAIHSICEKRSAGQEMGRYESEKEEADPMSAHERWAEDMRDMAGDRLTKALSDHRAVVFPALMYWPADQENPRRRYRYRENYEQIRNWCIDWVYSLLQPQIACRSSDVSIERAYAANGLAPELAWEEKLRLPFIRRSYSGDRAHGLSALEQQVAERICGEYQELVAENRSYDFFQRDFRESVSPIIKLKLLHIHFVLGLSGYEALQQRFVDELKHVRLDDLSLILHQPSLFQSLTTHCAVAGVDELKGSFGALAEKVAQQQKEKFCLVKSNLLCRTYHHAFVRGEFDLCLNVAREAQVFIGTSPSVVSIQLGIVEEGQSTTLTSKHWKYLELRAAIEIATESEEARKTLLSVKRPADYFKDEADYLIYEVADMEGAVDEWYVAPYGESILSSGLWLNTIQSMYDAGYIDGSEASSVARDLMEQLTPLVTHDDYLWNL